jgi:ssDNA-binding Zn-finger/Zn-ribbon topoisomerase 1
MTRLCMDCHAYMGEKCPKCGAVASLVNSDRFSFAVYECTNSHCAVNFIGGEGGNTHGLCPKCLGSRNVEMRERSLLSRGVQQEVRCGAESGNASWGVRHKEVGRSS